MNIVFMGIDLAKNVFQLCGLNQAGKPVYTKRTGRKELLQTLANIPAYPIDTAQPDLQNLRAAMLRMTYGPATSHSITQYPSRRTVQISSSLTAARQCNP
jgi:hypothetical protein